MRNCGNLKLVYDSLKCVIIITLLLRIIVTHNIIIKYVIKRKNREKVIARCDLKSISAYICI